MRELGDMAAGGAPVRPRPAATVVMVRDGAQGIEVFLVQRTRQARFMGGMYVFPGGALDPADGGPDYAAFASGLDDARASAMLGIDRGGLAYWIAALRECFEESGFLFANEADGTPVRIEDAAARACYADARERMAAGTLDLVGLCRARQLTLMPERLLYFSHWITPLGLPRRFDTRFFVAQVPSGQHGAADQRETIAHDWMRPSDALARAAAGEIELAFATVRTLEALAGFADCAGMMAHMREPAVIQAQQPRVARNGDARQVLLEGDHAFAEVGLLDPLGKGDASCVIVPGVVTRLSARVRRIAAPNSGLMTGPGTNSYLIGEGDDLVVIDPGPAHVAHVDALVAAAQGRVRAVLVTHTHRDHSPAARLLAARTGAELIGMTAPAGAFQDHGFEPDRVVAHGDRLVFGGVTLRVLHTPGHASNHVCYLLEEEGMLFSGDHVMQGSTVVIDPPDGDMAAYLASLAALQEADIDTIAPGHGFLIGTPRAHVAHLVAHRLARENKVLGALRRAEPAAIEQLLPVVYDDVAAGRHALAARSLLAHLLKLQAEGWAREVPRGWVRVDPHLSMNEEGA
ncbi:MBL fold metallo-hydrolase [Herbaspirillum rubrisubalbicans]|uniref:MBL fold metallo-hydrolase n=1 Tax=Herbaspirillum rubrisubalbicans TaxID=80842 RepID=UPI0015583A4C|nr:MBL fold metallo-hydrolase [Herbaspirillum rubrisubalbicans]NQE47284.1 hypothetical protein [Herbaspirillum rubrisubalbicans]